MTREQAEAVDVVLSTGSFDALCQHVDFLIAEARRQTVEECCKEISEHVYISDDSSCMCGWTADTTLDAHWKQWQAHAANAIRTEFGLEVA